VAFVFTDAERKSLRELLILLGGGFLVLFVILGSGEWRELRMFSKIANTGNRHEAVVSEKRHEYVARPKAKYAPNHRYFVDFAYQDKAGRRQTVSMGWIGLQKSTYNRYNEGDRVWIRVGHDPLGKRGFPNVVLIEDAIPAERNRMLVGIRMLLILSAIAAFVAGTGVILGTRWFGRRFVKD
jgi:hypothetical protein